MNKKKLNHIIRTIPLQKAILLNSLQEFNKSYSLREMASYLETGYASLSRIMNGKQNVSIETLAGYIEKLLQKP